MTEKQRTIQQNKSLHKYCKEMADVLNESGISMRVLVENLEVDHTMYSVKGILQAIGKTKFGKPHSSEWTTKELQEVWEEFNRRIAGEGIYLPFPSQENSPNYLLSLEPA